MDLYRTVFRPATTGEIANILLAVYSSQSLSIVGKNWLSQFIEYCDEFRIYFSIQYNYQLNKDPKIL